MQTRLLLTLTMAVFSLVITANAQTVSTFESLSLAPNSYWDGAEAPGGSAFTDGHAVFPNFYDPVFSYWANGWAYSNMKDSTTAGFLNLYSAITASGVDGSENYAEATFSAVIRLTSEATGKPVTGFYVTNSTYAALSMRDGDAFAKKFGGPSGNDPDWFKLTIRGWLGGLMLEDSVEFFLADFRFDDHKSDYILKTWQWVDLTGLGDLDSLSFSLSSSDTGDFGMNTPAFFCIDNFTTQDIVSVQPAISKEELHVFPNPATNFINIEWGEMTIHPAQVMITDVSGRVVFEDSAVSSAIQIPLQQLEKGYYFLIVRNPDQIHSVPFVKQ